MANIKFSQFTAEADINNFTGIVGYAGAVNTRISPADLASSIQPLIGPYLPLTAGATVPLTGDLYIGDGSASSINLFFQTTGVAGDVVEIQAQGTQVIYYEKGTSLDIGPNSDIVLDDSGNAGITMNTPTIFVSDIKDVNASTGNVGQMLVSKGGSNAGVQWVNAYKSIQTFVWTNGSPVPYVNFPPPPGTLPTNSGLPFDPTPLVDYNNLPGGITQADYNWTCVNNAGGDAGQIATFTLGQFAPDGVWRVSSANHWFDQNSFIEVIVEFVINGTGIQVTDERSNDGAGDKIYYGELYQEFSAGDTLSVFVTFQNSSTPNVTPFPSAAGNRPIEISFERIV